MLGPVVLCLVAVAGLLVAERRGSQQGLWLTKPVASAAFIRLGLASGVGSPPAQSPLFSATIPATMGSLL